ncbi:hypothetical protein IJ135_00570 [Candidatus Saccharibacteria bacterium]|nr:hypothetical protein [Candidatus Saccharibacteria bacterium]
MKPNQQFQNQPTMQPDPMMPQGTSQPVVGAQPAMPEAPAMAAAPSEPVFKNDAPKKNNGMMIGLIVACIVAVGGIAFGAFGMISGGQDTTKLQQQVATLQQQNAELAGQITAETITITTPSEEEVELEPVVVENTSDFIYVGEWGLKIAIPEDLSFVSYRYLKSPFSAGAGYGEYLGVSAVQANAVEGLPAFANPFVNYGMMCYVDRFPVDTDATQVNAAANLGQFIMSDGDYNYYFVGPQATYSAGDEARSAIEISSVEIIKNMLTNPENYSAI